MPNYIVKLSDGTRDYYFEFSTIVDAPVTYGMSREEFTDYYRREYGESAMRHECESRMKRVDEKGTSSRRHNSVKEILSSNRAGEGETCLTIPQILEKYCINPSSNGTVDTNENVHGGTWQ